MGYRFLDLSGYMFSGKAAAFDLVREFQGYYVPFYRYEFPLIRIQDGIMDLDKALIDDWSPIRSDVAVKRFVKLITKLANSSPKFSLKEEELIAWDYDRLFGGRFLQYSTEYIESLIDIRMKAGWPYYELAESAHETLVRRLVPVWRGRLGRWMRLAAAPWDRIPRRMFPRHLRPVRDLVTSMTGPLAVAAEMRTQEPAAPDEIELLVASGDGFYDKTRDYLEKLLSLSITGNDVHTVVMNNAFEPFNPWRALRYFRDAKCIVVDRDPRDMYVTSVTYSEGFNDNPMLYSKIAGASNVEQFIRRFQILRQKTNAALDPVGRVLRLRFEELVCEYDAVLPRVYDFLGETAATHSGKGLYFKPSVSRTNVGLWKSFARPDEIEKISRALTEYCYDS